MIDIDVDKKYQGFIFFSDLQLSVIVAPAQNNFSATDLKSTIFPSPPQVIMSTTGDTVCLGGFTHIPQ